MDTAKGTERRKEQDQGETKLTQKKPQQGPGNRSTPHGKGPQKKNRHVIMTFSEGREKDTQNYLAKSRLGDQKGGNVNKLKRAKPGKQQKKQEE